MNFVQSFKTVPPTLSLLTMKVSQSNEHLLLFWGHGNQKKYISIQTFALPPQSLCSKIGTSSLSDDLLGLCHQRTLQPLQVYN